MRSLGFGVYRVPDAPIIELRLTDAAASLIVWGSAVHHFETLHPLLGTLADSVDRDNLDGYILEVRELRGVTEALSSDGMEEVKEALMVPNRQMSNHTEQRLPGAARIDGMIVAHITVPEFTHLLASITIMLEEFEPSGGQYQFLSAIVEHGEHLLRPRDMMAMWQSMGDDTKVVQ